MVQRERGAEGRKRMRGVDLRCCSSPSGFAYACRVPAPTLTLFPATCKDVRTGAIVIRTVSYMMLKVLMPTFLRLVMELVRGVLGR